MKRRIWVVLLFLLFAGTRLLLADHDQPGTLDFSFEVGSDSGHATSYVFNVYAPGRIQVTARWLGHALGLALILEGPEKAAKGVRIDGPSPLVLNFLVGSDHLKWGTAWRVTVLNLSGYGGAQGRVHIKYPIPVAPMTQPVGEMIFHEHGIGCGHYYFYGYWYDAPFVHVHSDWCGHVPGGPGWVGLSITNSVNVVVNSEGGQEGEADVQSDGEDEAADDVDGNVAQPDGGEDINEEDEKGNDSQSGVVVEGEDLDAPEDNSKPPVDQDVGDENQESEEDDEPADSQGSQSGTGDASDEDSSSGPYEGPELIGSDEKNIDSNDGKSKDPHGAEDADPTQSPTVQEAAEDAGIPQTTGSGNDGGSGRNSASGVDVYKGPSVLEESQSKVPPLLEKAPPMTEVPVYIERPPFRTPPPPDPDPLSVRPVDTRPVGSRPLSERPVSSINTSMIGQTRTQVNNGAKTYGGVEQSSLRKGASTVSSIDRGTTSIRSVRNGTANSYQGYRTHTSSVSNVDRSR